MAKKVLWSVAAVAAVALVALRMVGYPPVGQGTEATIGAAQRYQEAQISAQDVKVEDQQFQTFLQSDLFRQLANDKAAQEALKNQDLQKALADVSVRAALARNDIRTAIANNVSVLARADVIATAIAQLRLDASSQAIFQAALTASPALGTVITNACRRRAGVVKQRGTAGDQPGRLYCPERRRRQRVDQRGRQVSRTHRWCPAVAEPWPSALRARLRWRPALPTAGRS